MKKTILLCVLALILGLCGGLALKLAPLGAAVLISPEVLSPSNTPAVSPAPDGAAPPVDLNDNGPLLEQGTRVLKALKSGDYAALSALVHPERGVTCTPYSTVDPDSDLCLTPAELTAAKSDSSKYIWGYEQGRGDPIRLTISDYFTRYVFNADYTRAPIIGVDQVLGSGNALENVAAVYGEDRFLEFYFPGSDPAQEGLDWCSLKLVFAQWEGTYKLVGLIHSEWTI